MNPYQRTQEWFDQRKGKLTCSSFGQAAGLGPGSRQQLWRRLLGLEVFDGNEATAWGEANESVAITAAKKALYGNGYELGLSGFVQHKSLGWLGGSPDLLVRHPEGALMVGEVKCPFSKKQFEEIPDYYMAQIQGLMHVTEREACDLIVWTPDSLRITRVMYSREYWDWLYVRIADFWTWVEAHVEPPRSAAAKAPGIFISKFVAYQSPGL